MIDYKEQMNDPRWVERSREIMKRDNFTCQLCGKSHTKLNVHHIRYIKGKDYWDYPDELLMTVCETCHQKIHGKYKANNPTKSKNRKSVFYNMFLSDDFVKGINNKILLSYLCYKSIEGDDSFVFRPTKIAKELNMSVNTISKSIKYLIGIDLVSINDGIVNIKTLDDIRKSKYFELMVDTKLKGEKLVVYSYLKNKSTSSCGIIHTFDKKQASEFHLSKKHYQKILCELYKDYYIERLENGKLKIN